MKSKKTSASMQIGLLCLGEVLLLGGLWWAGIAQMQAMNQAINDLSDLKDPSPYRAALMGHLGKITLGLQGYLRSPDPSLADQVAQSRKDFDALLPEFEHQNPRLFPPAASEEIRRTFELYKDTIDRTLEQNTHRMERQAVLDQNFARILYEIDHNIKPLIRKDQPDGEERGDAVLNIENQLRAWQQNLVKAWEQPSEPARVLTLDNDNRGETFVERYGGMELLPRERKIQRQIQTLWKANSDLARECFALETVVSQSMIQMNAAHEQVVSVLDRHLPAMPPAELDARKEGYVGAMRLHLAAACIVGLLGLTSVVVGALGISRLRRGSPTPDTAASMEPTLKMDLNGTISAWSLAAQALYGYHSEEILGQPITLLFESESEVKRLYRELQSAQRAVFETIHKIKAGKPIRVRIDFRPISGEDGHPVAIGLVCIRR